MNAVLCSWWRTYKVIIVAQLKHWQIVHKQNCQQSKATCHIHLSYHQKELFPFVNLLKMHWSCIEMKFIEIIHCIQGLAHKLGRILQISRYLTDVWQQEACVSYLSMFLRISSSFSQRQKSWKICQVVGLSKKD